MKQRIQFYVGIILTMMIFLACNFPTISQPPLYEYTVTPMYTKTPLSCPVFFPTSPPIGITATLDSNGGIENQTNTPVPLTPTNTTAAIIFTSTQKPIIFTSTVKPIIFTLTPTATKTLTRTNTIAPTRTNTIAPTRTLTRTPTKTYTRTQTRTSTITPTRTQTRTPTITPTRTQTRTPTENVSQSRPGLHHFAQYMSSSPDLDGQWDEYDSETYSVTSIVYGSDEWEGSDDLSGSVRFGWDENYLYVAVKVNDDNYVQNSTGYDIYLGDSLEINLDVNLLGDFTATDRSDDDYQLGISPGFGDVNGAKEAFLWFPRDNSGGKSQVEIASSGESDGYNVESAIPWSVFGIDPDDGDRFGFAFSISDNDDSDENVQQSMTSSVSGRKLLNPTTWGELILED